MHSRLIPFTLALMAVALLSYPDGGSASLAGQQAKTIARVKGLISNFLTDAQMTTVSSVIGPYPYPMPPEPLYRS